VRGHEPHLVWTIQYPPTSEVIEKHRGEKLIEAVRGVSRWDAQHLLAFEAHPTGRLVRRAPSEDAPAVVAINIVRIDTGQVERTFSLPLASAFSRIAAVSGGLVISNPEELVFFSREFKQLPDTFHYTYLADQSLPFVRARPRPIYVTPDQKYFALVDTDGRRGRIIIFDGTNFHRIADVAVKSVHIDYFSMGNDGFAFSDQDSPSRIFMGDFKGFIKDMGSQNYRFRKVILSLASLRYATRGYRHMPEGDVAINWQATNGLPI